MALSRPWGAGGRRGDPATPGARDIAMRHCRTSPRRRARPHRPTSIRARTGRPAAQSNAACWIGCGCKARRPPWLKLHLWRLRDGLALIPEIEKLLRRKAERGREQRRRELRNAGIVFAYRIVKEAPRGGDLVFDIGELGLQLLEIRVRLEVRVGLRQRDQAAKHS